MASAPKIARTECSPLLPVRASADAEATRLQRSRLEGVSVAGLEAVIAAAGGRQRLTKGVGWYWVDTVYVLFFLVVAVGLSTLIPLVVLLKNQVTIALTAAFSAVAFIISSLCVDYRRDVVQGGLRRGEHRNRPTLIPTDLETYYPCFFPWVYTAPKTTEDFKSRFIIPATARGERAYIDVLRSRSDSAMLVGDATVFVSHSYSYLFLDAIEAIILWAECNPRDDGSPHFFYFDVLVNSQHGSTVIPFSELQRTFAAGVRATSQVLLILSDLADPVALSRSWCIFEVATALSCGKPFDVIMPPNGLNLLMNALKGDADDESDKSTDELIWRKRRNGDDASGTSFDELMRRMCFVDVERASAREPADQENINRMIVENLGGFLAVNQLVIGIMRNWITVMGMFVLENLPPAERAKGMTADHVIGLLRDQSCFSEAEAICRATLEERRAELGADHERVRATSGMLAQLLSYQGKDTAALVRETLVLERRAASAAATLRHGATHPTALAALHDLAEACAVDDPPASVALYGDALAGRRKVLGDAHPDTRISARNLVSLLASLGREEEAAAVTPRP